ncbi:hypothetical protein BCR37DRAFT_392770 [Protomyces lactucae-debilis]|uniref:Small nuclear ribonucleoprotein Prp3 C-terminal domain-containing protein n=1 Tax=Protomyces lactucae-debilis TaxID=2754530 RepID=A0A1Y2FF75_PROLT|nr:uncharacterized protein BCR37DRAFT_392770 [Protomyces lactucae-debilis]ORY82561.1 hypothetical protein BCR37DRAFT_392770 [Protomyces lactucae-debilis]
MYQEDELAILPEDLTLLQQLEQLDHLPDALVAQLHAKRTLDARLMVKIDKEHTLTLLVKYAFFPASEEEGPTISLIRPTFLSRLEFEKLAAGLPSGEDVLASASQYLLDEAPRLIARDEMETRQEAATNDALARIWFYLPSLSTRSKRLDMCRLAPHYNLTGFVLAGKPGVLCLEGTPRQAQAYMADIKCNSWADIPSFQKKITERLREDNIDARRFQDMAEITDAIAQHGQRGNRGDLGQVEAFLKERDLGHVFGFVFMQQM